MRDRLPISPAFAVALIFVVACGDACPSALPVSRAPFKDGDRVVFFGDSITHGVEAGARIEMGAPFTDGAILQRGMSVPVWGRVAPRAGVTGAPSFEGRKVKVSFAGTDEEHTPRNARFTGLSASCA